MYRLDTASHDTAVTHEGRDSAFIERDQTAEVHLSLAQKGSGSVHVCVEVEGRPADSACVKPPQPLPTFADLCGRLLVGGCYTKKGSSPKLDTASIGKLRINQYDSVLTGALVWQSGARDSSVGAVVRFLATGAAANGTWKGAPRAACTDKDSLP